MNKTKEKDKDKSKNQARRFVIGDVHGCALTLEALLFKKCKVKKEDTIYFLGDYIDRGKRIKKTLDLLLDLSEQHFNCYFLIGNHEEALLNALDNYQYFINWKKIGGADTLKSFKVNFPSEIPEKYIYFIRNLKYYFILDSFVLTHGGLNTTIDDPFTDLYSMLWTRAEKINPKKIGGRKLIVGHTPKSLQLIKDSLKKDVINLDGGCVYKDYNPLYGNLVALELNSKELFVQKNIDNK
ncbi:MAG: metallophosphoesterase [Candidatus Kapaibacteriota bacterium]